MKKRYKVVAEESAYLYQKQAWGSLVRLLDKEDTNRLNNEAINGTLIRGKLEAFMNTFNEVSQRHRSSYSIPDVDLRTQIREATVKLVVPAYTDFLNTYASVLQVKSCLSPEAIEGLVGQIFEGGDREKEGKMKLRRRESQDRMEERQSESIERSHEIKDFRRSKSNTSDA
ncbi:hypothetical protein HYC85_008359 [Camellia sinensis]|uniref:Exocyst subunit Exo70 family protein n=1 Tax=Camellia sinensis TaxID=4442 RepID=A0A7J7HRL5_CAMSI|nr:hypothetical protein HYC85_008359 [Camellia sinensis]